MFSMLLEMVCLVSPLCEIPICLTYFCTSCHAQCQPIFSPFSSLPKHPFHINSPFIRPQDCIFFKPLKVVYNSIAFVLSTILYYAGIQLGVSWFHGKPRCYEEGMGQKRSGNAGNRWQCTSHNLSSRTAIAKHFRQCIQIRKDVREDYLQSCKHSFHIHCGAKIRVQCAKLGHHFQLSIHMCYF